MTGFERTMAFIKGTSVDRPPFHPIIMRWAAAYSGVKYRDFCTIPSAKCDAMLKCAEDFDLDWVTVMSDPWAEASAFGIQVEYPEDSLPVDTGGHLPGAAAASVMKSYNPLDNARCANRISELALFREKAGNDLFIVGWVEGPVAEYVDLRGASNAAVDFLMETEAVEKAMDIIVDSAMDFISLQVRAGAHCIGIGDAFCSQIGPDLYNLYAFSREKKLVDHIHDLGAAAKLHICGNTASILPAMIKTGADIIDVDHLVPSMAGYSAMLGKEQVFSGKSDPVTVIQEGSESLINHSVITDYIESGKRCIVSAGCEITPGTSCESMKLFRNSASLLNEL